MVFDNWRRQDNQRLSIVIATAVVGLTLLAPRAGAAIMVTDGTLHVSTGYSTPPDVPFVPPATDAGAYTRGAIGAPDLYAQERVSFVDAQVGVSTSIYWVQPDVASASGNLNVTEDAPETMLVRIDVHRGHDFQGRVSLDAVGGDNLFDKYFQPSFFDPPPFEFLAPVPPGQYTLTWSAGWPFAGPSGTIGYGGFDFTMGVPESSGLLLIAPAALVFMRRRGPQGRA